MAKYGDYRIVEGGLGYILQWWDGVEWQMMMDSVDRGDCVEAMIYDSRCAHTDRWGE